MQRAFLEKKIEYEYKQRININLKFKIFENFNSLSGDY